MLLVVLKVLLPDLDIFLAFCEKLHYIYCKMSQNTEMLFFCCAILENARGFKLTWAGYFCHSNEICRLAV